MKPRIVLVQEQLNVNTVPSVYSHPYPDHRVSEITYLPAARRLRSTPFTSQLYYQRPGTLALQGPGHPV